MSTAAVPSRNTRERVPNAGLPSVALAIASLALAVLSIMILKPFLPVLSWALAFAVIAYPVYSWLFRKTNKDWLAAGLATAFVALLLVGPITIAVQRIFESGLAGAQTLGNLDLEEVRTNLRDNPRLLRAFDWAKQNVGFKESAVQLAETLKNKTPGLLTGSIWSVAQFLMMLFTMFFLFRDRSEIFATIRWMLPLTQEEADKIFRRMADTIYATIFGSIAVAAIQGTLGGLVFWFLGMRSPILWGCAMGMLALIPYLGTFVIWAPTAAYLALIGEWGKAVFLASWGTCVIGLIDNLLYPMLVGKRMRFHPLPVFFFVLGGIAFFGASGLVLGPVILALSDAVLEIWKARMRVHPELAG